MDTIAKAHGEGTRHDHPPWLGGAISIRPTTRNIGTMYLVFALLGGLVQRGAVDRHAARS